MKNFLKWEKGAFEIIADFRHAIFYSFSLTA